MNRIADEYWLPAYPAEPQPEPIQWHPPRASFSEGFFWGVWSVVMLLTGLFILFLVTR